MSFNVTDKQIDDIKNTINKNRSNAHEIFLKHLPEMTTGQISSILYATSKSKANILNDLLSSFDILNNINNEMLNEIFMVACSFNKAKNILSILSTPQIYNKLDIESKQWGIIYAITHQEIELVEKFVTLDCHKLLSLRNTKIFLTRLIRSNNKKLLQKMSSMQVFRCFPNYVLDSILKEISLPDDIINIVRNKS